jgi:5-methylcytosine-specific restriction endonuclease McrA
VKIFKVADIVNSRVRLTQRGVKTTDVAAFLCNLQVLEDPDPNSKWTIDVLIGEGPAARNVELELEPQLSLKTSHSELVFLKPSPLVYFRSRLFLPEHYEDADMRTEEFALRVKKHVFTEEAELRGLREVVANLEAVTEGNITRKRIPIPGDVKLLVWTRDGGACVYCGSKSDLHFDHVIPVSKGGGNSDQNLQILCQLCNLKKSDKIAGPNC